MYKTPLANQIDAIIAPLGGIIKCEFAEEINGDNYLSPTVEIDASNANQLLACNRALLVAGYAINKNWAEFKRS